MGSKPLEHPEFLLSTSSFKASNFFKPLHTFIIQILHPVVLEDIHPLPITRLAIRNSPLQSIRVSRRGPRPLRSIPRSPYLTQTVSRTSTATVSLHPAPKISKLLRARADDLLTCFRPLHPTINSKERCQLQISNRSTSSRLILEARVPATPRHHGGDTRTSRSTFLPPRITFSIYFPNTSYWSVS